MEIQKRVFLALQQINQNIYTQSYMIPHPIQMERFILLENHQNLLHHLGNGPISLWWNLASIMCRIQRKELRNLTMKITKMTLSGRFNLEEDALWQSMVQNLKQVVGSCMIELKIGYVIIVKALDDYCFSPLYINCIDTSFLVNLVQCTWKPNQEAHNCTGFIHPTWRTSGPYSFFTGNYSTLSLFWLLFSNLKMILFPSPDFYPRLLVISACYSTWYFTCLFLVIMSLNLNTIIISKLLKKSIVSEKHSYCWHDMLWWWRPFEREVYYAAKQVKSHRCLFYFLSTWVRTEQDDWPLSVNFPEHW